MCVRVCVTVVTLTLSNFQAISIVQIDNTHTHTHIHMYTAGTEKEETGHLSLEYRSNVLLSPAVYQDSEAGMRNLFVSMKDFI